MIALVEDCVLDATSARVQVQARGGQRAVVGGTAVLRKIVQVQQQRRPGLGQLIYGYGQAEGFAERMIMHMPKVGRSPEGAPGRLLQGRHEPRPGPGGAVGKFGHHRAGMRPRASGLRRFAAQHHMGPAVAGQNLAGPGQHRGHATRPQVIMDQSDAHGGAQGVRANFCW